MKRKTSESYICRMEFTILICLYFTACGEECSNPILCLWEGPPLLKPQLLNVHQDGTDVLLKYPFLIISMKNHVTKYLNTASTQFMAKCRSHKKMFQTRDHTNISNLINSLKVWKFSKGNSMQWSELCSKLKQLVVVESLPCPLKKKV